MQEIAGSQFPSIRPLHFHRDMAATNNNLILQYSFQNFHKGLSVNTLRSSPQLRPTHPKKT